MNAVSGIKGEVATQEPTRAERAIARRSAESRATVPSVEYRLEAEVGEAVARAGELGVEMTSLLLRAAARALRGAPRVNGAYRDGRYESYSAVNVGVTIATAGTYVIATVFGADTKSELELAGELASLRERAGAGELTPAELSGATFTLTGPLPGGVEVLTPVVVPPQAAALASGPVRRVPTFHGADVVVGNWMSLTLACDHRILYGAEAAGFLTALADHLKEGT